MKTNKQPRVETTPDKDAEIIIGKLDGSKAIVTYGKESSFSFLIVKKGGESELTVSTHPGEIINLVKQLL